MPIVTWPGGSEEFDCVYDAEIFTEVAKDSGVEESEVRIVGMQICNHHCIGCTRKKFAEPLTH